MRSSFEMGIKVFKAVLARGGIVRQGERIELRVIVAAQDHVARSVTGQVKASVRGTGSRMARSNIAVYPSWERSEYRPSLEQGLWSL